MSDFHQHGPITTLHRLSDQHLADLEQALLDASSREPTRLILPCHAEDIDRPAMARIRDELKPAGWLTEILVSVNGCASREEIVAASRAGQGAGGRPTRWIWSDGPAANALRSRLENAGLITREIDFAGKGWNVWLALGLALSDGGEGTIALHDADIANYRREMLVRLCAPVAHRELSYGFAKGYYRRFTEGVMFGRVTRLFVAPLLRAAIRVLGHHPLLDYFSAFRYPLAGECAFTTALARDLPVVAAWGLEVDWLCEVHRRLPPERICQVELGANYEHKHRPLRGARGRAGLVEMAREIAAAFVGQLRAEGAALDATSLRALAVAYQRTAAEAVERHAHDALLNGLRHDEKNERATAEAFSDALNATFAAERIPPTTLPAWSRVFEIVPGVAGDLRELVVES